MSDDRSGGSASDDADDTLPGTDLGVDVGALDAELGPDEPSIPSPDIANTNADADASRKLRVAFWGSVLAIKVGAIAATLGLLVGYFRGRWRLAMLGLAIGVVAFANAYRRYRGYQNR